MALVPQLIIAGSVPSAGKEPAYIRLQREAMGATGTELIRFVSYEFSGWAYYLAVKASDLTSGVSLRFPLSVAVPGNKQFQGPGMYVAHASAGEWVGVLVAVDERDAGRFSLRTYCLSEDELMREAEACGAAVHKVGDDPDQGDLWEGADDLARSATRSYIHKALWSLFILCVVFGLGGIGAGAVKAYAEPIAAKRREDARAALDKAISTVSLAGTKVAPKSLEDLDRLVAIANKELGRVKQFKNENGKTEFEFEVPLSANYEAWRSLGPLQTRISDDGLWRTVQSPSTKPNGQKR